MLGVSGKRGQFSMRHIVGAVVFAAALCWNFVPRSTAADVVEHGYKTADLVVSEAWAPPTEKPKDGAPLSTYVYLSVHNRGTAGDQIVSATASIARKTDFFGLNPENKIVPMGAIDLPPRHVTSLYPGGPGMKLTDLQGALTAGDRFTLHIEFADAKALDIPVVIRDLNADSPE